MQEVQAELDTKQQDCRRVEKKLAKVTVLIDIILHPYLDMDGVSLSLEFCCLHKSQQHGA